MLLHYISMCNSVVVRKVITSVKERQMQYKKSIAIMKKMVLIEKQLLDLFSKKLSMVLW